MVASVLGSVSLGYQLLWNQLRQLCGVQLFVGAEDDAPIDARHLLGAIGELWSEQAPVLLLAPQSRQLLTDLLTHAPVGSPWLEVHQSVLDDQTMVRRVVDANQRGLKLIWRGEPGTRPSPSLAPYFERHMFSLTAEEALTGLRISLRKHNGADTGAASQLKSPVSAGQMYEAVASRVLAEHCLDEQAAWAVAGWPMEDVLHGYRQQRIQPGHRAVVHLIQSIDADDSMEYIEHVLSEEPVLAYRFMRYANSAALGLRSEIESLRHGLMVLGLSKLRTWLLEQLPHATSDLNLEPIRAAMVVRARLMENLLDAGDGDDLRRDVFLCGLLSQMDLMLGEPLTVALTRIPFAQRITSAILAQSGPYLPYLEVACAMESANTSATRAVCDAHEFSAGDVNRALLRTLCDAMPHPAKGLLLV